MKLVPNQRPVNLQDEIKKRFTEFNKSCPPSRNRRIPSELKQLVCRGHQQGLAVKTLCQLACLSSSAVYSWLGAVNSNSLQPRRLAVTDAIQPKTVPSKAAQSPLSEKVAQSLVVIRLASGVTIELAEGCSLNADLLKTLNALEVDHVTAS